MIKRLKDFKLNEEYHQNKTIPGLISIEDFLSSIRIDDSKREDIADWWGSNRRGISIHYFDFKSDEPISGVFIGEDSIAINRKLRESSEFKLFVSIHESFHCEQERNGEMEGYFSLAKSGSISEFSDLYKKIEKEANDFAINSMKKLGFFTFVNYWEMRLRSNEYAGAQVYHMMRRDIEKTGAKDFKSLLLSQIL